MPLDWVHGSRFSVKFCTYFLVYGLTNKQNEIIILNVRHDKLAIDVWSVHGSLPWLLELQVDINLAFLNLCVRYYPRDSLV